MTHTTKWRDWSAAFETLDPLECWHYKPPCSSETAVVDIRLWCLNCLAREMFLRLIEIDPEPVEPIPIKLGDVMEAGKTYRLESGRVKLREEWIDGSWCLDDGEETESK